LAAALFLCAPARVFAIAAAQWQADLQSLAAFLESTHPNLFFHVCAQDFNAAVNNPAPGVRGPRSRRTMRMEEL
jgi:hypothetical protein